VAEWRAERKLIERVAAVVVMGMASFEVQHEPTASR
jgi:hypothetical protein